MTLDATPFRQWHIPPEANQRDQIPSMNSIQPSKLGLVLLVDDDAGILFTFKLILEEEGYLVTAVGRGAAARKLLKEHSYDAAVIDLNQSAKVSDWNSPRRQKTSPYRRPSCSIPDTRQLSSCELPLPYR